MRRLQVYRVLDHGIGWLLPPRCALCRGPGQFPAYDLCVACEGDMPGVPHPCPRCGLGRAAATDSGAAGDCSRCRGVDLPYSRCLAPWAYEFPVTQLVQALKYEGALANARILGTRLASHAGPSLATLADGPPLIVPMPLHPTRLIERGFNQSREIASIAARRLGLAVAEAGLRRVRVTAPQVGLARTERASNLHGAFVAERRIVAQRSIILLDDVVTTGSTVAEASRTLLEAGAAAVQVWAAARALG